MYTHNFVCEQTKQRSPSSPSLFKTKKWNYERKTDDSYTKYTHTHTKWYINSQYEFAAGKISKRSSIKVSFRGRCHRCMEDEVEKKKRKKRKKRKRKGRGERSVRENEASGGTSLYFKHEVAPVVHVHSGVLRVHVLRCSTVRLPSGRPVIDRAIYLAEFSIFRKLEKTIPRIVLFLQYANFTLEFTIQRFYSSAAF